MKQLYRWCFLDFSPVDYHVLSPEQIPLGGSQSALAFLAQELTLLHHPVSVLNRTSQPGHYAGVDCQNVHELGPQFWQHKPAEFYIAINEFTPLTLIPKAQKGQYQRLFWNPHNHLVSGMEQLKPALLEAKIDGIIFVSDWQRHSFIEHFGLPTERCYVQRNAMSNLFLDFQANDVQKKPSDPTTLAYTSHPGRGLGVLLAIFPALKKLFPELELKVFSSLKGYQANPEQEATFEPLYQECKVLDGVHYFGSITQAQLAREMASIHFLAYPSRYMETSCIAAIEALAAGCRIVSTDLGALPETCGTQALLCAYQSDHRSFTFAYFQALEQEIRRFKIQPQKYFAQINQARNWAFETYTWRQKAQEWQDMADHMMGLTAPTQEP